MEISNVKEQNSSWLAAFSKRPIFFMSRKEMAACFDANGVLRKSRLKNVEMAKDGCTGSMFTCVQAIKNLMKNYNARGEWVEPTTGLTGLLVTDEMGDSYKRMIDIPESSKEKMFEYVKNNYIEKMEWRTEQEKRKFIWICIKKWTRMIGCRQAGHWASTVRRIRRRLYLRSRKLIRHGHMAKPYLRVSWRVSQGSLWKLI